VDLRIRSRKRPAKLAVFTAGPSRRRPPPHRRVLRRPGRARW
jgi:hypothetical protein